MDAEVVLSILFLVLGLGLIVVVSNGMDDSGGGHDGGVVGEVVVLILFLLVLHWDLVAVVADGMDNSGGWHDGGVVVP